MSYGESWEGIQGRGSEYDTAPAVFLRIVRSVDGSFATVHPEPTVDVRPAVQALGHRDHSQLLTLPQHIVLTDRNKT